VEHVANGADLFRVICDRDMEGIVAKQASARYTPEATTWVKIKSRQYVIKCRTGRERNLPVFEKICSICRHVLIENRTRFIVCHL
jgi:ATP-dependent DNA ligase